MKLKKDDMVIGIAGLSLFFIIYTRATKSIWDDIYLLIVILALVVGAVALSGGITGLI